MGAVARHARELGRRKTRRTTRGGGTYRVEARSLALFRLEPGGEGVQEGESKRGERAAPVIPESPAVYHEEPPVESVYCANAGTIVPLDEGFCRACSTQVSEGDGVHRPVTPELLGAIDYATTEVPRTPAQGEAPEAEEEAETEVNEEGGTEEE